MTALAMTREEFCKLLEEDLAQWRAAEERRLRECARLSEEIARIVDQHPRNMPFRQIASRLGVAEGTRLLELVDLLEEETRDFRKVQP